MSSSAPASVRTRLSAQGRGLAEAAVERARLTVVPRTRSRAPRIPFVTLVSALLLSGVVGLLLFNTSMQQAAFTTTSLEEQATNLAAREQSLQLELEQLRDPQNLAVAARRQGMVESCAPLFLEIGSGAVAGERTTGCTQTKVKPEPPTRPGVLDPAPIVHQVHAPEVPGSAAVRNPAGTARGDGAEAAAAGRNDSQQHQQSHESQQQRRNR